MGSGTAYKQKQAKPNGSSSVSPNMIGCWLRRESCTIVVFSLSVNLLLETAQLYGLPR